MNALKTVLHKTFGHHTEWSTFEKAWLLTFTAISLTTWYITKDSPLGLITSLSGMLCVVLVAKGKISNYFFGALQTALYGWIALQYGLLGENMLNWYFYLPVNILGVFIWAKHAQAGTVTTQKLTPKGWLILLSSLLVSWLLYTQVLNSLNGNATMLDSATNVLSIAAQILMLQRYSEQWLLWIAVNVLSITLWVVALTRTGGSDWSMVIMWSAFLANAIYGWVNWNKMHNTQQEALHHA